MSQTLPSNPHVLFLCRADGVAELILNKPEKHNAFDDSMIDSLIQYLDAIGVSSMKK